jgi:hypothetical protein
MTIEETSVRELFIEGAIYWGSYGIYWGSYGIKNWYIRTSTATAEYDSLKIHNGNIISLRDEQALRSVVREAKRFDSAELQKIYAALKCALKTHLNITQNGI